MKRNTRSVPRASDEKVLLWLSWRKAGVSSAAIGATVGRARNVVQAATDNVRKADLAESGEPEELVLAGYRA